MPLSVCGFLAQPHRLPMHMQAFDCINQTALRIRQSSQPDQSVEEALHGCGWKSHDLLDSAVEWELTSANNILSPANLSLLWMLPDPTYQQVSVTMVPGFFMCEKSLRVALHLFEGRCANLRYELRFALRKPLQSNVRRVGPSAVARHNHI